MSPVSPTRIRRSTARGARGRIGTRRFSCALLSAPAARDALALMGRTEASGVAKDEARTHIRASSLAEDRIRARAARDTHAQIVPLGYGQLEDSAGEWRDICPVHGDGLRAERGAAPSSCRPVYWRNEAQPVPGHGQRSRGGIVERDAKALALDPHVSLRAVVLAEVIDLGRLAVDGDLALDRPQEREAGRKLVTARLAPDPCRTRPAAPTTAAAAAPSGTLVASSCLCSYHEPRSPTIGSGGGRRSSGDCSRHAESTRLRGPARSGALSLVAVLRSLT